ncbi:MAG: 1,4-alpha-glucan branching protein GlgB [Bdellovibrionales bacterium]|nr:1,4-alpha-glucan branching protein GlgB [Bdellovibrionales bacterium]
MQNAGTSGQLVGLSDLDIHLHREGVHLRSFEKLGAHISPSGDRTQFAVWAPNAKYVSVVGDFNAWDRGATPLATRNDSGIWEASVPGIGAGSTYKYYLESGATFYSVEKADPYAFYCEQPPRTASVVWDLSSYKWNDGSYMATRPTQNLGEPMTIYEVHLGSWRRTLEGGVLTYKELASQLCEYVTEMGFTHVELLPIAEHPFDGSWGYQTTSYFAPTSRFGTPDDFKHFVDMLHQNGIGVILDWTPAHFPTDQHGLGYFDGTYLYEHEDPRKGFHPDWGTLIFQYGRHEVRNFLVANALFWLEHYHIDALRVDAVASMLYLDYSREEGAWEPNKYGGRENIEAIDFLRILNETVYREHPSSFTIAEESTAWPMVSRPTSGGGLGFGYKWNMGWMNDTLSFFSKDPIHRSYHLRELTFSLLYAFNENFVLPISHDEVVHGKGSVLRKMPGDDWQKFANTRLLYGYMYGHPGKKLLFMGSEFGQWDEWQHDHSLDWHLLDYFYHQGLQRWVQDLNFLLINERALFQLDHDPVGFEWVNCDDQDSTVVSFVRYSIERSEKVLVVCNFTPVSRGGYRVGVPEQGHWDELLNSDSATYGGSNVGNFGGRTAEKVPWNGRPYSICVDVPPLGVLFLKHTGAEPS